MNKVLGNSFSYFCEKNFKRAQRSEEGSGEEQVLQYSDVS